MLPTFFLSLYHTKAESSGNSLLTNIWHEITQGPTLVADRWRNLVVHSLSCIDNLIRRSLACWKPIKPLSQWEVSSGDLELTRCKSTVKAICVGLANSANYPDQWSDATFIWCKLHCERGKFFISLLGCVCCSLARFPKRPSPSFLSESLWLSIERAFKFKGLYFDFVYMMAEAMAEMLHDCYMTLVTWFNTTDVLVVPQRDYQLRHLAVIPLRLCLVRQRPD